MLGVAPFDLKFTVGKWRCNWGDQNANAYPPETPDGVAVRAPETAIDLDRWRTAVELVEKLKEAGVKCRVTLVPAKRRD